MAPTAPPFFPHGANSAPFSSVSARFRKTRRYTNVVCCEVLSARIGKTGRYTNGFLPPEDPAFGAKPRPECSANFFLGRTHLFNLSLSFPRFAAWPLELGLGTHNPRGDTGGGGRGKGGEGRGEGGNTAALKTFFSARTRKRYYRIPTSVPPNPQTHTPQEVCMW